MLLSLVLTLFAQEAPSDKPAPISAPIVSWYRFDRLERVTGEGDRWIHHGFAREKLTPVGGKSWSYDYTYEFVFIMPQGETKLSSGRLSIEAQLDANFEAIQLDGSIKVVDGESRQFILRTEGDRRVFTVNCGDRLIKVIKSIDDPATPLATLMLMSAYRTGNLKEKCALRLIDPWSAKGLVEVEAAAGKPEKREILGQNPTVIDITLEKLPAMMPEIAAFPVVTIDRFGRYIAAESADGKLRLSLAADEQSATQGDAMLQKARGRDPFVTPKDAKIPTYEVTLQSTARINDPDKSLERAQKLLTELREHILAKNREKADAAYLDFLAIYRVLWDRLEGAKQAKLEKLRIDAETMQGGVAHILRRAEAIVGAMNDYVDALELDNAEKYFRTLQSLEKHDALWRRDEQKQVQKFVADGEAVLKRGRALAELTARKLVLTGTAVTSDPSKSYAVINDKNLRVGDMIDGIRVESIGRDAVVVSLNGVKRELTLAK